jgi:hypothetical protein
LEFPFGPVCRQDGDAGGRQLGRLWGTYVVVAHLRKSYKAGPFRIDPDYGKVKDG